MKAMVDPDTCIGCGLCCGLCDAVFRINDEGKAEAYQAADDMHQSDVQEAINTCPVSAIRWEE